MPTNSTPRTTAITMSVVAALRASGGLKAGTPVAIASVPVRATAPDENARSRTRIPTAWVVSCDRGDRLLGDPRLAQHDDAEDAHGRSSGTR